MRPPNPRKRLIVIGAGFAGINLVKQLKHAPIDIILIDKHNYHLFQPLLYQVATAALSPADIAYPIRRIFRKQKNVQVILGEVERIDLATQQIFGGEAGEKEVCIHFDYLALCVGATHSYFGHDNLWPPLAPGLKNIDDATEIRRRLLLAFEEAELEDDEESRRAKLTFVVVGGGPTGVELAGALREIAADELQKDFRHIDTNTTRVILMEGGNRLLAQFPPKLSDRAKRDLEAMGVEVRLNTLVTNIDEKGVYVGDDLICAQTILWAAGVAAPPLLKTMQVPLDRSGRVIVAPDLSIPDHPNIFVLGDAASAKDSKTQKPIPGLAPAAIQMGKFVGKLIRDEVSDKVSLAHRPAFRYRDKGIMATIGTKRAVADIKGLKFGGTLAWLTWSLVHIAFLISFRNKLFVMLGWIYDYLGHAREARLITGEFRFKVRNSSPSPGTPGEGRGEGSAPACDVIT